MIRLPLERSARSTELAMASVAFWMSSTIPFFTPCDGVMPTPRMRRSSSGVISPDQGADFAASYIYGGEYVVSHRLITSLAHWKEGRSSNLKSRTWPTIASRPSLSSIASQTASL